MKTITEISDYVQNNFTSIKDFKGLNEYLRELVTDDEFTDAFEIIAINPKLCELFKTIYETKKDISNYDKVSELYEAYLIINDLNESEDLFKEIDEIVQKLSEDNLYDNDDSSEETEKSDKEVKENEMLKQLIKNATKYPLLTDDETTRLFYAMANGSNNAEDQLVKHNLRLVLKVAHKFIDKDLDITDIIQEGNIGLLKAIRKFDVSRGYKFSTYAIYWIRQNIGRAIIDKSRNIRLPSETYKKASKINKIIKDFEEKYDRIPTIEEIAEIMHLSQKRVAEIYNVRFDAMSLNEYVSNETDTEFQGLITSQQKSPEDIYITNDNNSRILSFLNSLELNERDIQILYSRYEINGTPRKTLTELGEMYNVSPESIRQVESRVLRKVISMNKINELCALTDNHQKYKKLFDEIISQLDIKANKIQVVNHILEAKKVAIYENENGEKITTPIEKAYYQLNIRILSQFTEEERAIIYLALSHENIDISKIAKKAKQSEEYVGEILHTYYLNFQLYLSLFKQNKNTKLTSVTLIRTKEETN